ncbi:MAG: AAA family ATPase [Verrucomicrobiota bacterium JB022]|nr:AAA family ATPase [Verrucomicrobiota bacterium JB022]
MEEPAEIKALKDALAFSPENVPLHLHLVRTLQKYGRHEAALEACKEALRVSPQNPELEHAMAQAYLQLEKRDEALVILESQEKRGVLTPAAQVTFARLLSQTTELIKAAQLYLAAKEADPSCEDAELEEELAPFLMDDPVEDRPRTEPLREGRGDAPYQIDPERPRITFADVGGMDAVKEDIRMKIIHPIAHADLFKAYGKAVGGGILLYGPPGCGKTYLARATAGEVKASFYTLGLHEVLDMYIGQSEKNLHEVFQQARRSAPTILFIDEVDALGANRNDLRHSAGRNVINQFLSELDGVESSNDGLLVLGATNAPWHLDSALRRPGRFDQIIFVPPPDEEARAAILRVMLKDKPAENINYEAVARRTDGFSGADLKAVVERAVEQKLDEAMKKGGLVPLSTKDLEQSAKKVKPSTKEWFAAARNYALYANQAGLYDDILAYLGIKK